MKIFYIVVTTSIFICTHMAVANYEVYHINGHNGNMNVTIRMWKENTSREEEEEEQVLALSALIKFDEFGQPPGRYRMALEQEQINNSDIDNISVLRKLEREMRQDFLDEAMVIAGAKRAVLTDHNQEDTSNLHRVYHLYDSS